MEVWITWLSFSITWCSYFDDDNEADNVEYQPAPGSPGPENEHGKRDDSDSDDPLDAFMAGIEVRILHSDFGSSI